ncbi:MAG: PASTA domain-containing protein [Candidatus Cloacimonetes bacterium]|nr:PASTA domain-containing protein [Candidatus Cloacimonadota bacterium]
MKTLKTIGFVVLSFIIISLLGFVISRTVLYFYTHHRNEVEVPELSNKDYRKAKHDLYKMGLYINKVGERNSMDVLSGSIISQEPQAKTIVKKGYTIDVIVSKGPELIKIPTLDNLTLDEARIRLINSGLEVGNVNYSYSNEIQKGKVIYSQPVYGIDVPRNSKVDLVMSLGKIPSTINSKKDIYDSLLENLNEN